MPALIVNTWIVVDGRQEEFVDGLVSLFDHLRGLEGFVQGQILQGSNPTRYVSMAMMRSAEDRARAVENPHARALLRGLKQMARPDHDSYTRLHTFKPDPPAATVEPTSTYEPGVSTLEEEMVVAHFIVSDDVERSRRFYADVLGGKTVIAGEANDQVTYVALANSWVIINRGGGPTDDKPSVTRETPADPHRLAATVMIGCAGARA